MPQNSTSIMNHFRNRTSLPVSKHLLEGVYNQIFKYLSNRSQRSIRSLDLSISWKNFDFHKICACIHFERSLQPENLAGGN